ncbi:MAG: glycosyltransferase family 4 protein [Planctomycetaceae bacterium]|jgi:glycosyltransferase involved in cell wall biosynthesis|nr:glycosyltransferase family 4 protein [Planctomycetaceae bacterium]
MSSKLLHLCLTGKYTDGYSYQENILTYYHKKLGLDVVVIASLESFDNNGLPCLVESSGEYVNSDGIRVIRLKYKNGWQKFNQRFRRYAELYDSLQKEQPDILFIHGCQFADISVVVKYLKQSNKKVTVYIDNHSDFSNSARNWISKNILHKVIWRYYAKKIEPFVKKFYGVLPARCDFLENMYQIPREKIELLVMGADDEKIEECDKSDARINIRKQLGITKDDFVMITGGKIDRYKNIDLLMESVCQMNLPNLKLIVFGSIIPELKSVINDLSNHESICYIGWLESGDVYKYFGASDLAVFPGRHSVLWEQAVGCGLPAIFMRWDGMTHVDIGGNCIFLAPVNIQEIKKSIEYVLNNKKGYQKMKDVATSKGKNIFSYKKIAQKAIEMEIDD